MKVAIAGAGKVGRSIAKELHQNGHEVLLIDKDPVALRPGTIEGVRMIQGDACEVSALEDAQLPLCSVMIAATGDDKTNLVAAFLAKTEFGVSRVVARVNHPKNEWLFTSEWGVDVAVSTPRLISALVEEAVSVGDLVSLLALADGKTELLEIKLEADSPCVNKRVDEMNLPADTALVAILREQSVITPSGDQLIVAGDELLFLSAHDQKSELETRLTPKASR